MKQVNISQKVFVNVNLTTEMVQMFVNKFTVCHEVINSPPLEAAPYSTPYK